MGTTSVGEVARAPGRPDRGAAGAHLSELFARHGPAVLGLCRMVLRQREEAEDALQQTFLAAYRSLLNGVEPRHPAAWLASIARNECWARLQQRRREPPWRPGADGARDDPVAAALVRADLAELCRAIRDLPAQQREALLLREFGGFTYSELAEALAVSEPAVESLLVRARRRLRLRLRPAYTSAGGVAPLAAIREALARIAGGMPDPATTGLAAKVGTAPLLAKLAAGAAVVAVAGGTVAELERHPQPGRRAVTPPARSLSPRRVALGAVAAVATADAGAPARAAPARVSAARSRSPRLAERRRSAPAGPRRAPLEPPSPARPAAPVRQHPRPVPVAVPAPVPPPVAAPAQASPAPPAPAPPARPAPASSTAPESASPSGGEAPDGSPASSDTSSSGDPGSSSDPSPGTQGTETGSGGAWTGEAEKGDSTEAGDGSTGSSSQSADSTGAASPGSGDTTTQPSGEASRTESPDGAPQSDGGSGWSGGGSGVGGAGGQSASD